MLGIYKLKGDHYKVCFAPTHKALNPIDVSLLGATAVMFDSNDIAHLVE
jgi:hypothetical protein